VETKWLTVLLLFVLLVPASCTTSQPGPVISPSLPASLSFPTPVPVSAVIEAASASAPSADPFTLISQESLFTTMEDLTAIQPYSGWRSSATEGEQEAIDYIAERLREFEYLQGLGLEL